LSSCSQCSCEGLSAYSCSPRMGWGQSKSVPPVRQPLHTQQQREQQGQDSRYRTQGDVERQQGVNDAFQTHDQAAARDQSAGTAIQKQRERAMVVQPVSAAHVWIQALLNYVVISACFAYVYHYLPIIPLVVVAICAVGPFVSFPGGRKVVRIGPITPMLHFLAIILGILTGLYAYEAFMWLTYTISFGREYSNVLASESSAAYWDAGSMWFAQTSNVDTSRSVGYMDESTYCVAPILDSGPQQTTVGFWAVGMDCCGERGAFECHNAGLSDARGAVRVPMGGGMLEWSHKSFERAVKQAAAVHGLTPESDPMFVYWVRDPKQEQLRATLHSLGVIAVGSGLFAVMGITVSSLGQMMAN